MTLWTGKIFETINQVDTREWDALIQGRPFADWRWLQVTEALLDHHRPRYVLLRRAGCLVAGAVCSIQNRFHSKSLQAGVGWLLRAFPSLRCDVPLDGNAGLFFLDSGQIDQTLPELLHVMQPLFQRERTSFYSFDHLSPDGPIWSFLQAQGYHRFDHVFDTNLDIRWPAWEGYLKSLSPSGRLAYTRAQEYLDAQNITVSAAGSPVDGVEALQQWINEITQRSRKASVYHTDVLARAREWMGEDFQLVTARQNGQVIGALAMLCSARDWIVRWPGLDAAHARDDRLYDSMLFESIRQAILQKGRRIGLGPLDYPSTQRFGLTVEKWVGALVVRNSLLHWFAGRIRNFTANRYAIQAPDSS